jgi:hypothetical protein
MARADAGAAAATTQPPAAVRARRCVSSSQTCTCTAVESTFLRAHQAQCPRHSGQAVQSKSPAPGCVGVPATHSRAPRDMCRAAEGWRTLHPPRTRTHPHRIYPKPTHTPPATVRAHSCCKPRTRVRATPHTSHVAVSSSLLSIIHPPPGCRSEGAQHAPQHTRT